MQIAATLGNSAKTVTYNIGNGTEEISMLDLARRCAMCLMACSTNNTPLLAMVGYCAIRKKAACSI